MTRVRRLSATLALAGAFATFAACSSFSSDTGNSEPPAPGLDAATASDVAPVTDGPAAKDVVVPPPPDACASSATPNLGTNLLAYWKFENDTTDKTPNGHNLSPSAACLNGVVYGPGKLGVGSVGSAIPCAMTATPDISLGTNDFTVSLWVKRETSATPSFRYTLLSNGQINIGAQSGTVGTALNVSVQIPHDISSDRHVHTPFDFLAPANTGVWVHVLAFRANTTLGVRVNGRESTETARNGFNAAQTFYLAGEQQSFPWVGEMDEVAVWDRALTAPEMDALYNCGLGNAIP